MESADIVRQVIVSVIPILIAITFHEVAHGFVAYKLGDPTAKMLGRLTLNPVAHIDIVGTLLMPILLYVVTNGQFVFGYAKPVPINPGNFKNPKRDMALSAAGGPMSNLLLAILSVLILKYGLIPLSMHVPEDITQMILKPIAMVLTASVSVNVILASFNLIPVPPLDGSRVVAGFLPYKYASLFAKLEPYGMIIVIVLIATHLADFIVVPLIRLFSGILGLL